MDNGTKVVVVYLFFMFIIIVGMVASSVSYISSTSTTTMNVPYKNPLTGLNLGRLEGNKTYTYYLQITNLYNVSVRAYSFLVCDPETMVSHGKLKCNVVNGTEFFVGQSLLAIYDLTIGLSNITDGEWYIRVGCLKEGEDYGK